MSNSQCSAVQIRKQFTDAQFYIDRRSKATHACRAVAASGELSPSKGEDCSERDREEVLQLKH